jgi:tetratricopeptide (TPR) repeat protein
VFFNRLLVFHRLCGNPVAKLGSKSGRQAVNIVIQHFAQLLSTAITKKTLIPVMHWKTAIIFLLVFIPASVRCGETAKDFYNEGKAQFDNKHYREAVEHFNRAIVLNPHYATAYWYRGFSRFELKDLFPRLFRCNHPLPSEDHKIVLNSVKTVNCNLGRNL